MAYHQLTREERYMIYRLKRAGESNKLIARKMERPACTIGRELARNRGGRGYRYHQAHELAVARRARPRTVRFTDPVRIHVEALLKEGQTPEQISGRSKFLGEPAVSHERIYQHIYQDARKGGTLWTWLPRAKRRRKRRCPRGDRHRGRIPNQRMIEQRPSVADARDRLGDWEGDTVVGKEASGYLVTLVDRCSRFTLVEKAERKTDEEVTERICAAFRRVPPNRLITLTLDNGKEFAAHEEVAERTGVQVFFAHPYHSWERGTNENTNGLIRRRYPKAASFAGLGEDEVRQLEHWLNHRPRKCLGYHTSHEVFVEGKVFSMKRE